MIDGRPDRQHDDRLQRGRTQCRQVHHEPLRARSGPIRSDRYMLDTTEFNAVAKGVIPLSTYAGFRVFATHVQLDELNNDPNDQRRPQLISTFEEIGPQTLPTETALWDISKWDEAKYSADDGLFDRMLTRLIELDGRDRGENQRRDILIAGAAGGDMYHLAATTN